VSDKLVLIIEDEPAITRILTRKLNKMGFETKTSPSLSGAQPLLANEEPVAIFLDYVLEDGRSSDLVSTGLLKKQHKIFLMSAFMDDLEKSDFKGLNVTFLKKPFENLDEILNELK